MKKLAVIFGAIILLFTVQACEEKTIKDLYDAVVDIKQEVNNTEKIALEDRVAIGIADSKLIDQSVAYRRYPEMFAQLNPSQLTKGQQKLVNNNSRGNAWTDYKLYKDGRPAQVSAVISYKSMRAHASDVVERPSFAPSTHVAGEYIDGRYNARKMTWQSPSGAKSNNAQIQTPNYKGYLYNKSHLLAWSLGGDMEAHNVILGTRAQNVGTNHTKKPGGMAAIEEPVRNAFYRKDGKKLRVFYQATPIYKDQEIVPRAVHVRAYSINDNGKTINLEINAINQQPGVVVDYTNGTFRMVNAQEAILK